MINTFFKPPNTPSFDEEIRKGVLYFVALGVGLWIVSYIQMSFYMWAGENQAKVCLLHYHATHLLQRIREMFVRNVLRQEVAWFDKTETGELTSRLIGDIAIIQEGLSEKNGFAVQYFVTFLSGFVIAFTKGWKLALVLTAVIPVMGGAAAFMAKLLADGSSKGQDAYAGAGAIAQEVLSSIRTVTAFNGQQREIERYNKKLAEAEKAGVKKALISGVGIGTVLFLMFSCYALAFWYSLFSLLLNQTHLPRYGSKLVEQKEMDGGTVLNVFFAIIIGAFSLGNAGPNLTGIGNAQGAAYKVYAIIDKASQIDALSDKGETLEEFASDITFENIDFRKYSRSFL